MSNQIVVWGDNSADQITKAPAGIFGFAELLPGGAAQTIAIRTNGSLELWGQGKIPPLPPPSAGPAFGPIRVIGGAIASTHFVGIFPDGSVFSWGDFMSGNSSSPTPGLLATAVAVGSEHGCAIDKNGELRKWGKSVDPPKGTFIKIRARSNYTLAIRDDDVLYAWGDGSTVFDPPAVLWNGWQRDKDKFAYAPGKFKDIAGGPVQLNPQPHILAIDMNDAIWGWGQDDFGQVSGRPTGKFKEIGAGLGYSIAVDDNDRIHHWGENWGNNVNIQPNRPTPIVGLAKVPVGRFKSISAGAKHATALRLVADPSNLPAAAREDHYPPKLEG